MKKLLRRGLSLAMVAGLVAVPATIPALAQDGGDATISHRQSVLTQLSATGELDTSRVFTQLTVTGEGPVEVVLPDQSTRGLRDLGGLGRPNTDDDDVIYGIDATPAGVHKRTVANNTADLPVSLDVAYELDGEQIENPSDIVGRSGELTVSYTVRNETVEPQELDLFNARQEPVTETVDVGVPIVGTISLPLDNRFSDIEAQGANIAGDGRGNTVVNFSLVLFEPLGAFEQTVSWSAQVTDAALPDTNVQLAPVTSDSFKSLPDAQSAYADTFVGLQTITNGAVRIDMTMVAILDGASQLLDGMNQLADGSQELSAGLERAASGSRDLADGTGQAHAGSQELASGLGELRDGAGQVADGNRAVSDGANELAGGLGEIRDGAGQLSDGTGQVSSGAVALAQGLIEKALPGAQQVREGLVGLVAAFGVTEDGPDDGTIIGGINGLLAGLSGDLAEGTGALKSLTEGLAAGFGPDADGLHAGDKAQAGADGANQIRSGGSAIASGAGQLQLGIGAIQAQGALHDNFQAVGDFLNYSDIESDLLCLDGGEKNSMGVPKKCVNTAIYGALVFAVGGDPANLPPDVVVDDELLVTMDSHLNTLAQGASEIQSGGSAISSGAAQLRNGLQAQADSLGDWPADCEAAITHVMTADATGATPDGLAVILAQSCIAAQVDGGLTGLVIPGMERLQGGINNPACDPANPTDPANPCGVKQVLDLLAAGTGELASGINEAGEGAGALAAGAGQVDDGAKALHAGAGQAHDGSQELAAGTTELWQGARSLADGAVAAAAGGRDLSDGLGQIDDGANQLADGLGDARDGSGELAEGMGDAHEGGQSLVGAMDELQEFGTNKILNDVSRAGLQPDRLLKQARAADDRAKAGDGLPYGTAEGADASAVYQFEIAGVGGEEGASTPTRAGAAVLAFGAAAALGLGVRRRLI